MCKVFYLCFVDESADLRKALGNVAVKKQNVPGMLYKDRRSKSCQSLNIELPYSLQRSAPQKTNATSLNSDDKVVRLKVKSVPNKVPQVGNQTVGSGLKQQVNSVPASVPQVGSQFMESRSGQRVNSIPAKIPQVGNQTVGSRFGQVNNIPVDVPNVGDHPRASTAGQSKGVPSPTDQTFGFTFGVTNGLSCGNDLSLGSRFGQLTGAEHVGNPNAGSRQPQQANKLPAYGPHESPAEILQDDYHFQTSMTFTNSSYSGQTVSYGADGPVVHQAATLGSFLPDTLSAQTNLFQDQPHVLMNGFSGQTQAITTQVPVQSPALTNQQPLMMIPQYSPHPPDFLSRPPPPINQFQAHQEPFYQQGQTSKTQTVPKLTNPLKGKYDFKIVCSRCFCFTGFPGSYVYKNHAHKCEENVLAMICCATKKWVRVRERTSHRDFPGNYKMCDSITSNNPNLCKFKEERCSFAHNEAEKLLWRMEKEEKWNVTEFIMQQRSINTYGGYSAKEIISKHPGHFDFICRPCYFQYQLLSTQNGKGCSGPERHRWDQNRTLAHFSTSGVITLINKRAFTNKTAFFKICNNLHFCHKNITGDCRFAHSFVERDVWMLERDIDITPEQIVLETSRLNSKDNVHGSGVMIAETNETKSMLEKTAALSAEITCPYIIHKVCGLCFKNGSMKYQDGNKDQCNNRNKAHLMWSKNCIYINMAQKKEIRPLPNKIPANLNFVICQHIREKKRCDYNLGGPCQFAHSQEEIKIWQWMVSNKGKIYMYLIS